MSAELVKLPLKRLNHLSCLKGESHHLILALTLLIASFSYGWLGVALCVHLVWLIKTRRTLSIITITLLSGYTLWHNSIQMIQLQGTQHVVKIVYVEHQRNRFLAKDHETRFYVYYEETTVPLSAGDTATIKGTFRQHSAPTMPQEFDYDRFLKSRNIDGVFYADQVDVIEHGFSIHLVRAYLETRINQRFVHTRPYIQTFILADRSGFEETLLDDVSSLGIAHLFAVSGLHVSTMALGLFKGLSMLKVKTRIAERIIAIFLMQYMVITLFAASVVRAASLAVLLMINRRQKLDFTPVDLCSLLAVVLLLINPLYYVQTGFILTFLVTFTLLLGRRFLTGKTKIVQAFTVSLLAFFSTLPVIAQLQFSFNPLTPFLNVLFISFTTLVLLPMTYIVFFLPFLEGVMRPVVEVFEGMIYLFSEYFHVPIRFFVAPGWQTAVYYGLFWALMAGWHSPQRHRRVTWFVLFLWYIWCQPYLRVTQSVHFFHVDGDSILIQDAHNRCTVLIDTGTKDPHYRLVNALKSLHVTHLDYVFISHTHFDHYGAYEDVVEAFAIHHTVSNVNQDDYEARWIDCGSFSFYIFPLEHSHSGENNRSMVMKALINQDVYLFTGDIEASRELTILLHPLQADILKVPHHGSQTSSSEAFLEAVNPSHAIVSAHRRNKFGHPSDVVITRLEAMNIETHRTDKEGTITFDYFFNRRIKKTPFAS